VLSDEDGYTLADGRRSVVPRIEFADAAPYLGIRVSAPSRRLSRHMPGSGSPSERLPLSLSGAMHLDLLDVCSHIFPGSREAASRASVQGLRATRAHRGQRPGSQRPRRAAILPRL
jgi:hypothetical protein